MFDFRYHALSLVAVFVALLIGLLLGVAIGDEGLVSSAERQLRSNLRSDVADANRRADELRAEVSESQRFAREVYPPLVAGRLSGQRIALLYLGESSNELTDDVRTALEETGGRLTAVGTVREPLQIADLATRAADTRYGSITEGDKDLAEALGVRVGVQLISGGKLLGQLRPAVFRTLNGSLSDLTSVIVVRRAPDLEDAAKTSRDAFENGLIRGLRETALRVVGAEASDADPSQIRWYEDRDLSSVDAIDRVEGRAGLVLALAGAEGTFGIKDSADALLPDAVGATP